MIKKITTIIREYEFEVSQQQSLPQMYAIALLLARIMITEQ